MRDIPWTWSDVGIAGAVWGLLALGAFYFGLVVVADLRRLAKARAMVSGSTLLGTVAPFIVAVILARWGYEGINERHLERGEWRYTVGQVYENRRIKGVKVSRYAFVVNGERYEAKQEVDFLGGWRPLGSRWYVRFAVPDPDVHEHPDRPVPDSLTRVPPAGWPRLPAGQ